MHASNCILSIFSVPHSSSTLLIINVVFCFYSFKDLIWLHSLPRTTAATASAMKGMPFQHRPSQCVGKKISVVAHIRKDLLYDIQLGGVQRKQHKL